MPPPGWRPDPSWPAPPPGWQLWVPEEAAPDTSAPYARPQYGGQQHSGPQYGGQQYSGPQPSGQPYSSQQYSGQQQYSGPQPSGPQYSSQQYSGPPYSSQPYGASGQPGTPGSAGAQPYGSYPYPGASPYGTQGTGQPQGTNGGAVASLVLGILGFLGGLPAIAGIIVGTVSLRRIRATGERGRGVAIAGITVSSAWIALLVGLIILGAVVSGNNAQRNASSGQITHKGSENVFSLRVGDCFDNPPGDSFNLNSVTAIPCTQAHNAQVFAAFNAAGSTFPGTSALEKTATKGCNARIASSLDRQKLQSSMSIHFIFPQEFSWDTGQRKINCLVVNSTADLKSSLLSVPAPSTG